MCLAKISFLQRHAPKNPVFVHHLQLVRHPQSQSKTVELVPETRFVLFVLSVGLKSGYGSIFLKVLWHRNAGECLGLLEVRRGREKEHNWHHLHISKLCGVVLWSKRLLHLVLWCLVFLRGNAQGLIIWLRLFFIIWARILFLDLSPISLWHLHFTIEFFKDPLFLLIDEMRGSDKPD